MLDLSWRNKDYIDDENKIACYISGAHMTVKQGVLEQSVDRMIALGANLSNIQVVIGPGLGAKSYEFGENAPEYFSIPAEYSKQVFSLVLDNAGNKKYLVDIEALVEAKLIDKLMPENIHNLELDTLSCDLYDEIPLSEQGGVCLKRKTTLNLVALSEGNQLFFSARRSTMQRSGDLMQHNSGAYNTVGRHGAGFSL